MSRIYERRQVVHGIGLCCIDCVEVRYSSGGYLEDEY
jgi:hypothetical protein